MIHPWWSLAAICEVRFASILPCGTFTHWIRCKRSHIEYVGLSYFPLCPPTCYMAAARSCDKLPRWVCVRRRYQKRADSTNSSTTKDVLVLYYTSLTCSSSLKNTNMMMRGETSSNKAIRTWTPLKISPGPAPKCVGEFLKLELLKSRILLRGWGSENKVTKPAKSTARL